MRYGRFFRKPTTWIAPCDENHRVILDNMRMFPEVAELLDRVVAWGPSDEWSLELPSMVFDHRGDLIELTWCNILATLDGDGHILSVEHSPFAVRPDGKLMATT